MAATRNGLDGGGLSVNKIMCIRFFSFSFFFFFFYYFTSSYYYYHLGYLSSLDLRKSEVTLENVNSYYEEDIEAAESKDGFICHKDGSKEEITEIMIAGHDNTFIRKQGISCDFRWMLKEQKVRFLSEMDTINDKPLRQDYRSLAQLLDIPKSIVQQMEIRYRDQLQSVTEEIIKYWCNETGKRMTFQLMLTILRHPGLVGNKTAALSIEKTLTECGHKVGFINTLYDQWSVFLALV